MTTLSVRTALKRSIEASSNGAQTVIFTAKGQACIMNVIKKFDMSTIDQTMSGTHPAFIVNGVEIPQIYIGTYEGSIVNGEMVSQAYLKPASDNMLTLAAQAAAAGPGFHLMTNAEWAMLEMLAIKNRWNPTGNVSFGLSDIGYPVDYPGVNVDGYEAGSGKAGLIFTGSGPIQYRLDGTFTGISDLIGNGFEPVLGVRLAGSELQVIPNNNVARQGADWSASSIEWKAIDGLTGDFISPTYTGSFESNDYTPTTPRSIRFGIASSATDPYTLSSQATAYGVFNPYVNMQNKGITPVSEHALKIIKIMGLFPLLNSLPGNDGIQLGSSNDTSLNNWERMLWRGGYYWDSPNQGLYYVHLVYGRTNSNNASGRLAYYAP